MKATVAALTGLVAKETVVATFGILYHNSSEAGLAEALRGDYSSLAYSFLILTCFVRHVLLLLELLSVKWPILNGQLVLSVFKQA